MCAWIAALVEFLTLDFRKIMAVDPASIIAYIGFSLAVLSFAASTAGNLRAQYIRYEECKVILQFHSEQMKACQERLEDWKKQWSSGPRPWSDTVYRMYWGSTGYEDIQTAIMFMRMELDIIGNTLFGNLTLQKRPPANSDAQWRLWGGLTAQIPRGQLPQLEVKWYEKVCFAVSEAETLKTRITRFKERVDALISRADRLYWKNRSMDGRTGTITPELLILDHRREDWLFEHQRHLNNFYDATSLSATDWDVELALPAEQGKIECMDRPRGLHVGFHVWSRDEPRTSFGIFSAKYNSFNPATITSIINGSHRPAMRTHSQMTFGKIIAQIRSPRLSPNNRQRHSELLRARAAVGLVNWMILLWKTEWTRPVCSCGLAFVVTTRETQWTCTYSNADASDRDQGIHLSEDILRRKRLLHLGITIAELGLGMRIKPTLTPSGRIEYIIGDQTGRTTISKSVLVERLEDECSFEYADACRDCLYLQEGIDRNPTYDFRPQDLMILKERILDR